MFNGIITQVGNIQKLDYSDNKYLLWIEIANDFIVKNIGDSICCNGICLTVIRIIDNKSPDLDQSVIAPPTIIEFEISEHTFNLTNARYWAVGDPINLENALEYNAQINGHIIAGHVDDIAKIIEIKPLKNSYILQVEIPQEYLKFIAVKGSITLDGISLTVNNILNNVIEITILDYSYHHTRLYSLKSGDYMNLEIDLIARYLYRFVETKS